MAQAGHLGIDLHHVLVGKDVGSTYLEDLMARPGRSSSNLISTARMSLTAMG